MAEFFGVQINTIADFESISLDSVQLRDLKQGEVLIKVETSTINPSDYHIAIGHYGPGTAPFILGYEGSGTVLKSGGGEKLIF